MPKPSTRPMTRYATIPKTNFMPAMVVRFNRDARQLRAGVRGPRASVVEFGSSFLPLFAWRGGVIYREESCHQAQNRPADFGRSRRCPSVSAPDERFTFTGHHAAGDHDMQNIVAARHVVHDIEHQFLQQTAQGPRSRPFPDCLSG